MARFCDHCQHCEAPRGVTGGQFLCGRPVNAVGSVSHHRRAGPQRKLFVPVEQERQGMRTFMGRMKCGPEGRFFTRLADLRR